MAINQYTIEWHMKATCTWIGSILSIVVCLAMTIIELRRGKFSKSTYFTILIAIAGIGSAIMAHATFLQEGLNVFTTPDWLVSVRDFFISKYGIFLENLFGPMLDLLIICDGLILFVIICCPDKKDFLLSNKSVCTYSVVVVVVSGMIAALATKAFSDMYGPRRMKLGLGNYAWIADVAFRVIISFLTAIFHLVFTLRIRVTLKKSIQFLEKSNVATDAAQRYRRIMAFTTIISAILFFYNIIAQMLQGWCILHQQLVVNFANTFFDYSLNHGVAIAEPMVRYAVKMLLSIKPLAFGLTYMWARYPRDRQHT